jgi:hypothetical protein
MKYMKSMNTHYPNKPPILYARAFCDESANLDDRLD